MRYLIIACVVACTALFVAPAFRSSGIWLDFDSKTHITTIAQFHDAMRHGHIPVVWTKGFANYGYPLGQFAHQIPAYIGGLLTFATHDPVASYKYLVILATGIGLSGIAALTRSYTRNAWVISISVILFTLSPYRISKVYITGSLPEYMALSIVPWVLWAIRSRAPQALALLYAAMILTHPMLIILSIPLVLWAGATTYTQDDMHTILTAITKRQIRILWSHKLIQTLCACLLGFGISAYFLVPLKSELKYLRYGNTTGHMAREGHWLEWHNFTQEFFFDSCAFRNDIATRCAEPFVGYIEVGLVCLAIYVFFRRRDIEIGKLLLAILCALLLILRPTQVLYDIFKPLQEIQYPHRWLSVWAVAVPLLATLMLRNIAHKKILPLFFALAIGALMWRTPQIYGKSFQTYAKSHWYFTPENLHVVDMITVWQDVPKNYPIRRVQGEIVSGTGQILTKTIDYTKHTYVVQADTDVKLVDYTFYFPGWQGLYDDKIGYLQWQDPAHRGYITMDIPQGMHTITIFFAPTKARIVGWSVSILSLGVLLAWRLVAGRHPKMKRA